MTSSFNRSIANEFAKRVEKIKEESITMLASGRLKDHSEYRYSCGYLKGLDDCKTIVAEIMSDLQKG